MNKALRKLEDWEKPKTINTDKNPTYTKAIEELKTLKKCSKSIIHGQVKYLNNRIESDHGKLKRLILRIQIHEDSLCHNKRLEMMRMFKKGQLDMWKYGQGITGEIRPLTTQLMQYFGSNAKIVVT